MAAQTGSDRRFAFDRYVIDLDRACLMRDGTEVSLRPKSFDALVYLVKNRGRIAAKDELIAAVWPATFVTEDSLVKCIQEIRSALNDEEQRFVRTVPRRGYLFDAELSAPDDTVNGRRSRTGLALAASVTIAALALGLAYFSQRGSEAPVMPAPRSVAVMPFTNLSPDPDNEYFAAGIHESILNQIVRIGDLNTIARTTMQRYAETDKSLGEIARELNVQAILEGSVRFADNRVLVTAQLIEPDSDLHLWSNEYDRPLDDIFAIQADIARQISAALEVELSAAEDRALDESPVESVEAYQLYLRGRYHWEKTTSRDLKQSIGYYQQAINIEPGFARAYAGLADSYAMLQALGTDAPEYYIAQAKAAADRALELDPDLAEGYVSRGLNKYFYDWDHAGGDADLEKAIALSPNLAVAHQIYGKNLVVSRRFDKAERALQRALELDPYAVSINKDLGEVYYFARRYDQAIAAFERTLELEPRHKSSLWFLTRCYEAMGARDLAVQTYLDIYDNAGTEARAQVDELRVAFDTGGWNEFWRHVLEHMHAYAEDSAIEPYRFVELYVRLGEIDDAFSWLDKAFEVRSAWVPLLLVDPLLDDMRSDPRFDAYLERANLVQYADR